MIGPMRSRRTGVIRTFRAGPLMSNPTKSKHHSRASEKTPESKTPSGVFYTLQCVPVRRALA